MSKCTHQRPQGFTLFELLVALAIFSLVSVMAYSGLREVMQARAQTDEVTERLAQVQMTFLNLSRDLGFVVRRPVRGQYGDALDAFTGAEGGVYRMELTREGRRNPARLARSTLERVAYAVEDETLFRLSWPVLDRAQDTQPRRRILLKGVRELQVRYLDTSDEWMDIWPPLAGLSNKEGATTKLPRAVEVVVVTEDWGELRRVFELPES